MNSYEKYEQLIAELSVINEEIRKNWVSESSGIFTSSFDDSVRYIKKITERFRSTLEKKDTVSDEESLSDFSF